MAVRNPLVVVAGQVRELPAGDTLPPGALLARERLTAARTYYVRTDGSDSNTGLSDSAGGAFLTIQKAIDTLCALDLGLYDCTIQVRTGTFTGASTLKRYIASGGKAIILGDATTPSNVVISTTSANCFSGTECGLWALTGLKLQTTTSGRGLLVNGKSSNVELRNIDLGACVNGHITVASGAFVRHFAAWSISGNAPNHWTVTDGGTVIASSQTCTLTGTPAFSTFASVDDLSLAVVQSITFSGSATGARYSVAAGGLVQTFGGGATYLPGNAAGSTATGGQYL